MKSQIIVPNKTVKIILAGLIVLLIFVSGCNFSGDRFKFFKTEVKYTELDYEGSVQFYEELQKGFIIDSEEKWNKFQEVYNLTFEKDIDFNSGEKVIGIWLGGYPNRISLEKMIEVTKKDTQNQAENKTLYINIVENRCHGIMAMVAFPKLKFFKINGNYDEITLDKKIEICPEYHPKKLEVWNWTNIKIMGGKTVQEYKVVLSSDV